MPDVKPNLILSIWGNVWRGLLMGLAEVVPGVSGGTMALITGIYGRLIESIAAFGFKSLPLLRDWRAFYAHHQLGFLLPLAAGMGVGILLFAQVMGFLLSHYKPVVWAFFFGVIMASVLVIGKQRAWHHLLTFGGVGVVLALLVVSLDHGLSEATPINFFLAGMLAVSAWILPAISGSYVMLIIGLYEPVIDAIRNLEWLSLFSVAAGCVVGLALFVRLLSWLLNNWYEQLLALLTGFMLGSVLNLWPWKIAADVRWEQFVSPAVYSSATGEAAYLGLSVVAVLSGSLFLWLISRQRI